MGPGPVRNGSPRIFITGASGYIGRHAVRSVLDHIPGAVLRCLTVPAEAPPPGGNPRLETVTGDLTEGPPGDIARMLLGCDIVLHLAGYGLGKNQRDWQEAFRLNVAGTFRLARAAIQSGIGRFVMAQTALEYGPDSPGVIEGRPLLESDPCRPAGIYPSTKYAGADLARSICREAGIPFLGLRVFNTFGPGEPPHKLVPANILASMRKNSLSMTSGRAVRDFVFVGDVGRAFALALRVDRPVGQHVINIGSGNGTTVADLAQRVCSFFPGAPGPALGALPDREGEPASIVADISRAREVLGWEPTTGRETALRMTVEWYRLHYNEKT